MGSVVAKFRGPNVPAMPAFVGLADSWKADVYGAGYMGHAFEPVKGSELPGRLAMPDGVNVGQLQDRAELRNLRLLVQKHSLARADSSAEALCRPEASRITPVLPQHDRIVSRNVVAPIG